MHQWPGASAAPHVIKTGARVNGARQLPRVLIVHMHAASSAHNPHNPATHPVFPPSITPHSTPLHLHPPGEHPAGPLTLPAGAATDPTTASGAAPCRAELTLLRSQAVCATWPGASSSCQLAQQRGQLLPCRVVACCFCYRCWGCCWSCWHCLCRAGARGRKAAGGVVRCAVRCGVLGAGLAPPPSLPCCKKNNTACCCLLEPKPRPGRLGLLFV